MNKFTMLQRAALVVTTLMMVQGAQAAISPAEAEHLKSNLTPLGAERAGNASGSIPAWNGGYTTPIPGFENGGRRGDPFAADKPLYSVTVANMAQYADKLTDGAKALFAKYPDTYRIDVYPTRRTAAAPQWVYDNTFKNATRATIVETENGAVPQGAYGGIPFPVPKNGVEVLLNHQLRWQGVAYKYEMQGVLGTASGKQIVTVATQGDLQFPYYDPNGSVEKFDGNYWMIRLINDGPPVRAGEGLVSRFNVSGDAQTWLYLTGQRRVRKLPNDCCDMPTQATAGVMSTDDLLIFTGKNGRFDWKLVGKKEMLIPYNSNKLLQPTKVSEVLGEHHINPDVMRWELHRVWVVEATLKAGQRHQAPRGLYYFDEDTWSGVLADRWDAKGQLWKTMWMSQVVMPDVPATVGLTFGFNDLISGTSYTNYLVNETKRQFEVKPMFPNSVFTPDGLVGEAVR